MKKFFTILTALMICIALNFGLTDEAQAAEIDSSIEAGGSEVQELYGPPGHHRHKPPPHWGRHRHHPPPPPHWGRHRHHPPHHWDRDRRYPPPPPPHHGRHDRW